MLALSRFSVPTIDGLIGNSPYGFVCDVLLCGGLVEAAGDVGIGGEAGAGVVGTLVMAAAAAAAVLPRVWIPPGVLGEATAAGVAGLVVESTCRVTSA